MKERQSEKDYFDSYTRTRIHRDMISDRVRTETYRRAIMHNKHLFKDKVVLDVGCGTGILSLFAAKAGAKKVYGVDMSEFAFLAGQNAVNNNFNDKVEIIKGKMEEVELPEKVDVIISEWMGYCLFYESMLDSVLFARDKWLNEDGIIMPDKVELFIGAFQDRDITENVKSILTLTEFDMSALRELAFQEPAVILLNESEHQNQKSPYSFLTLSPVSIKKFDLMKDKVEDIEFETEFGLKTDSDGTVSVRFYLKYLNRIFIPISFRLSSPTSTFSLTNAIEMTTTSQPHLGTNGLTGARQPSTSRNPSM